MFFKVLLSRLRVSWNLLVNFYYIFFHIVIFHFLTICLFRNMLIRIRLQKFALNANFWTIWLILLLISSITQSTLIRFSHFEKSIKKRISKSSKQNNFKKNQIIFAAKQSQSNQSIKYFVIKKFFKKKLHDVVKNK